MPHDRETFRQLASLRLEEAKLLLRENQPSGAYNLAGYAIECAIKASISAGFRANEIPDWRFVRNIYSHDLASLLDLAGLESDLKTAMRTDVGLRDGWTTIRNWSEQSRYSIWTYNDASAMIDAVAGRHDVKGIFQWLSERW
jgi:hypothetical protein